MNEQISALKQALRDAGWTWVLAVWRPWGYGFAGKQYCVQQQDNWAVSKELSSLAIAMPDAGQRLVDSFEASWDARKITKEGK